MVARLVWGESRANNSDGRAYTLSQSVVRCVCVTVICQCSISHIWEDRASCGILHYYYTRPLCK